MPRITKQAEGRVCRDCARLNHELTEQASTGRPLIDGRLVDEKRDAESRRRVCGECKKKVDRWYEYAAPLPKVQKVIDLDRMMTLAVWLGVAALIMGVVGGVSTFFIMRLLWPC